MLTVYRKYIQIYLVGKREQNKHNDYIQAYIDDAYIPSEYHNLEKVPLIFIKRDIKRYFEEEGLKQHLPYGFGNEIVIRLTKTTEELNTLKRAINANESHPIIEVAVEWLKEVEFYITTRAETVGEPRTNHEKTYQNDTVKSDSTQIGIEEFNALEEEFERMVSEWK